MESNTKKIIVQSSISLVLESQVSNSCNDHRRKIRTQAKSEWKVIESHTASIKEDE